MDRFSNWLFSDRIPVTKSLIVLNGLAFLVYYVGRVGAIVDIAGFLTSTAASRPWTAFTYPLTGSYGSAEGSVFSLLFACYWLWIAGGSIERSWGSTRFAMFFAEVAALTALGVYIGAQLSGATAYLYGLWVPLAGLTVAFAMLNPEQVILLMFVIPIKLKYLAIISAAALVVSLTRFHSLVGICSLLGCGFAYWYVRTGRQYCVRSRRRAGSELLRVYERERPADRLNPLKWLRRRAEREKLRKLFEDTDRSERDNKY